MSALDLFFRAHSWAIVGASNHRLKVGHQVVRNLRQIETFAGTKTTPFQLYPINPSSSSILDLPVYPSLNAIIQPVDIVIIATPVSTVNQIVDEVITRNQTLSAIEKVKGVIIISAGFAESGEEGKNLQKLIAVKLQLSGIALLGPNTLGLMNPHKQLNASFAQREMYAGNLGIISQSGAILSAMLDALNQRQCGISFAVSLGNKAGINENDCLEYALSDSHTDVVLLYLESFTDLPIFFEKVSEVRQKKPVIVLKGGTSQRGQQASLSHTAALATNQVLLAAAAKQIGFTLVETLEDFLAAAFFFAEHHKVPENVLVITNAGGPAVNTIDDLQNHGVPLAQWSQRAKDDISDSLPNIPAHNPLDLLGDATPERFALALRIAQHDMNVDAILLIVTPQAVTDMSGIVAELIKHRGKKPLFVSLVGGDQLEPLRKKMRAAHLSANDFPNESVEILSLMQKISHHMYQGQLYKPLQKNEQNSTHLGNTHLSGQGAQLREVLIAGEPHPSPVTPPTFPEIYHLLQHYGFRLPTYFLISQRNLGNLENLPYPLYVKTANLSLLHKKQLGAVYGIAHNADEAKKAYQQLAKFGNEVLYQEILEMDLEILLGVEKDPQFGWYMTIGLGGSYTNLLADRQYIFLNASKTKIKNAWMQTKAATAVTDNPVLSARIVECMVNLQLLVQDNQWLKSLEINPLATNQKGIWVADVKVGV